VRRFCAGRKRNETAGRNAPLQPITIEAGPLVMTRNRMDHRIMRRGRRDEIRRKISAHQKSTYSDDPQYSMKPPGSMLLAAAIGIQPHVGHFCE
jgi:hypothetical protein